MGSSPSGWVQALDGHISPPPVTCLLEVSTSLDIVRTGHRAALEFIFLECQQNPFKVFVNL